VTFAESRRYRVFEATGKLCHSFGKYAKSRQMMHHPEMPPDAEPCTVLQVPRWATLGGQIARQPVRGYTSTTYTVRYSQIRGSDERMMSSLATS
jgi:hypothetical protein